jgi:hypothetical protein
MHAEELAHKPMGALTGILITLAIVAGLWGCMLVVAFLQVWLQAYWIQIFLYAGVFLLAVFIIKKRLTAYIYLIERDRVTFGRRIGRWEKELLFIPLRDIVSFGPYEAVMDDEVRQKKRFCFSFRGKGDWYVINCRACYVIMTPTQTYMECLTRAKDPGRKPETEGGA